MQRELWNTSLLAGIDPAKHLNLKMTFNDDEKVHVKEKKGRESILKSFARYVKSMSGDDGRGIRVATCVLSVYAQYQLGRRR